MTADALKSPSITNLDATPVVANSTGVGAVGYLKEVDDYVKPTAAGLVDTGSKYQMVRLPSACIVKSVELVGVAALDTGGGSAALALDVGLYYSDSTVDGTSATNQGTSISVNLFAAAITTFGHAANNGAIAADTSFGPDLRNEPLWKAAGLSSDPGGFFDVVVAVHTAANTAASQNMGVRVRYVD